MNPLVEITKAFTSFWLWTVVFAFTGAFMWHLNDALGKQFNRRQLSHLLRRRYALLYHELLQAGLARVDRWLTPKIGPSDEAREAEGRRAWSWPLLDLSLRLALAYPLLTLVITWSVLGTEGKLGSLVVLPAAEWGVRLGALLGLATYFLLIYRYLSFYLQLNQFLNINYTARASLLSFFFYTIVNSIIVFIFFVLTGFAFGVAVDLVFQGAFGGAVAISVAVAVAFGGAFAGAAAAAFSVAVAVFIDFVTNVVFILADSFEKSISDAVFFIVLIFAIGAVVTVVFVGAAAVVRAVAMVAERTGFGLMAHAGLVTLLLASLTIAVRYSPQMMERAPTLIVFLGLLPLLNAVFDFFSIGLTRFLLRRGAMSSGLGVLAWALSDVASALGFFALLGLALVTMAHWLNELGAAPLLDLAALFTDIRADPGAYWWLYVTIFSTLLPTLLHLVLASFSALLAIMPEDVALFIRRQLLRVEVDAVAKALAFWTLSTIGFLAIAAVAFGLYGLVIGVLAVFPHAGDWYLWLFERYAAWLGAPVVSVRPGWL